MKILNIFLLEIYYILTSALIVFVILEIIWPSVVLAYFNLNWLLLAWLIIGIVILKTTSKQTVSPPTKSGQPEEK